MDTEMGQSSPFISVITVVFNAAASLEKTIQSVIGQRQADFEYVIIDGGSTDGTLQVIRRFESSLALWLSEPDEGIYDAMNKGIRASRGGWLIFLNAGDTFIDNQSLQRLTHIAQNGEFDLIYGDAMMVHIDGTEARMDMQDTLPFLLRNMICHQSILYRRECFEQKGYFDTSYRIAADFEHLLRLKWSGAKITKLDAVISRYQLDGLSAKQENISKIWKERMKIYSGAKSMPLLVRCVFWLYAKIAYEFRKRV